MRKWRILDEVETGWLDSPDRTHTFVEYQGDDGVARVFGVASRSFILRTEDELAPGGGAPWTALPQLIIIPDGDAEGRLKSIDLFVQGELAETFSQARPT